MFRGRINSKRGIASNFNAGAHVGPEYIHDPKGYRIALFASWVLMVNLLLVNRQLDAMAGNDHSAEPIRINGGITSEQCVEQDTTVHLRPGQGVYLGDHIVHPNGSMSDTFYLFNRHGAISFEQSDDDGGTVTSRPGAGFDYVEKHRWFELRYENWKNNFGGVVTVYMKQQCLPPDEEFIVA